MSEEETEIDMGEEERNAMTHRGKLHYRQYSMSTLEDFRNVENGRCPEYALQWDTFMNALYWPPGHDYYMGNGKNIQDNFERRLVLSKQLLRNQDHPILVEGYLKKTLKN